MTAVATTAVDTHSGAAARRRREAIEGYLFLLPNILGFLIFFAGPLILSVYYSLTDWDLLTPPKVIWFQNFVDALKIQVRPAAFQAALAGGKGFFEALGKLVAANDPMFWKALGNTVIYAFGVIAFAIVPAFLLAYLLNSKLRGMTFFRGLYYLPVVASVVGVALVYLWIFYREGGAVNYLLGVVAQGINGIFGSQIPKPVIGWLNDPTSPGLSLFTLIILSSWRLIGYDMVIFLAALQAVPTTLVEAMWVDGASRGLVLRKLIIPLLTPTIFFILVTNLIEVLQVFSEPYIMTHGGPANATITVVYYLYQKGFMRFQMGYASALAWIAFGIILAITTVQFRLSKRWVVED